MDHGYFDVKLFGLGFVKHVDGFVPSCSFEVETIAENSIVWFVGNISWLDLIKYLEIVVQFVNGDGVLSCEILKGSCKEGLREEESGNPVGWRVGGLDPLSQECYSLLDIYDP
jgi:hypothetical protein